jgi:hypothetical protein
VVPPFRRLLPRQVSGILSLPHGIRPNAHPEGKRPRPIVRAAGPRPARTRLTNRGIGEKCRAAGGRWRVLRRAATSDWFSCGVDRLHDLSKQDLASLALAWGSWCQEKSSCTKSFCHVVRIALRQRTALLLGCAERSKPRSRACGAPKARGLTANAQPIHNIRGRDVQTISIL